MSHEISIEQYKSQVKAVWVATAWLSLFTVVEVGAALLYMQAYPNGDGPRMLLNLGFILFSLLKAGFIVGEFMHVRYEARALALTILTPLLFLIWFIIAFIWEGTEWQNNRNTWGVKIEDQRIPAKGHGHSEGTHDSSKPAEEHSGH